MNKTMIVRILAVLIASAGHAQVVTVKDYSQCKVLLSSQSGKPFLQTLRFPKDLNGYPKNTDSLVERMRKINLPAMDMSLPQFPHTPPTAEYKNGFSDFGPFQMAVPVASLDPYVGILVDHLIAGSLDIHGEFVREFGMAVVYTVDATYVRYMGDDRSDSVSYEAMSAALKEISKNMNSRQDITRISFFHTHPESTMYVDQKSLSFPDLIFALETLPGKLAKDFQLRVSVDQFVVPSEAPETLFYTWVPGLNN